MPAKRHWPGEGIRGSYREDNQIEGEAAWKRDKNRRREGVHVCPETSRSMGNKKVGKVTQQLVALKKGQAGSTNSPRPWTHNDAEAGGNEIENGKINTMTPIAKPKLDLQNVGCF